MAIMATTEQEGTALLDVVAGLRRPVVGDIFLNGQNVKHDALKTRVAYVQNDAHLCKDMTALQTLRFHYDLKKPTDKLGHLKIDAMDRVSTLLVSCIFYVTRRTISIQIGHIIYRMHIFVDKCTNRRSWIGTSEEHEGVSHDDIGETKT